MSGTADTTHDPSGSASRPRVAASSGDIRLIQAYLRAVGEYGDPREVRGIDVVTGTLNTRTFNACERFMRAQHGTCTLSTDQQVDAVIATLRRAHRAMTSTTGVDDSLAVRTALASAFAASSARQRYPALDRLHPQMRFPLAAALDDLKNRGIEVVINEGYRPPERQEALVRLGHSTAVPTWSLHGYGLAIDITPRSNDPANVLNPQTPQWQTTLAVMQRYGFYSLYANQRWDLSHFELPSSTSELRRWPDGADGFKDIPDDDVPEVWRSINAQAVSTARTATTRARPRG